MAHLPRYNRGVEAAQEKLQAGHPLQRGQKELCAGLEECPGWYRVRRRVRG